MIMLCTAWLGTNSKGGRGSENQTPTGRDVVSSDASSTTSGVTSTMSSSPKSVSVPNLSIAESTSSSMSTSSTTYSSNSVFSSPLAPTNNNLSNMSSSSLFDGLGAISRVRSLINSSRLPSSGTVQGANNTSGGGGAGSANPSGGSGSTGGAYPPCSPAVNAGINHPSFNPTSSSTSSISSHHHSHHHSHHFHQAPGQSNNPFLFGRAPHSVSSLVRIALSSHFPGLH